MDEVFDRGSWFCGDIDGKRPLIFRDPSTNYIGQRASVHLVEKSGVDRGPLGEAFVNPPPPAPERRYNGE